MIKAFIKVCLLFLLSFLLYGNIYFWIDEEGIKHFSNITPPLNERVEELTESHIVSKKLSSQTNKKQIFKVLRIFDGDTIKVTGLDLIFKIRFAGIDSPEIGFKGQPSQPFSQKAKDHLTQLLNHKKVAIKSYGTGAYNRQLAEVFLDGKNINLEMIKSGLAEVYKGQRPKNFDSQIYIEEQLRARNARKGMWVQGSSYKSPRQWRKEHPRK